MSRPRMKTFGTTSRTGYDSSEFYRRKIHESPGRETDPEVLGPENHLPSGQWQDTDHINLVFQHSSESMHELPTGSVHLMVTSPPYNVGKDYDSDLTMEEYRAMLCRVWEETHRVLAPGGRACVNVANLGRKPYIPLNQFITADMLAAGFLMRGEIIWNKSASAGSSCAWGSWRSPSNPVLRDTHEYILVFCKDRFSRKPGDGEATIGRDEFLDFTRSVWEFPAASARKVGHPAPFPVELPRRLIQLYTWSGDLVLDPFMGSGQTALAAAGSGRNWVGYDTSVEYVELTRQRVRSLACS